LKYTSWALEQVKARDPSDEMAQAKLQALVDALGALRGKAGGQVFGMRADRIEPEGRPTLEASIIAALGRWKQHFQSAKDPVSLLALDGVGKAYDISDLVFGTPNIKALYEFVLRHEAESGTTFPRELAAFWAIADGISIDDDPVLRPIAEWAWDHDDRGPCIGCGGYVQGSLIIESPSPKKGLLRAKVVDVDDDGEERIGYPNFAAFADALLGA